MALLKRKILPAILEYLPKEQIIFLIGPRQVGKTSILKLIQAEIVNKKIEFLSFNLEDKDHLDEFNESPKNLIKAIKENYSLSNTNKIIVFIDEIQYLKDPSNFLKYIYDEYKDQIKLIVSGSSSFYLDSKFRDSLSGRKIIFEIKSLDFEEFLNFRNQIKILKALDNINQATKATQDQYHDLVNEFMVYGGYPAVVLENKPEIKKQLLADYVNSYLKKDILENNIKHLDKLYKLMALLARYTGSLINKNELATTLSLSASTVDDYLLFLNKTFIISMAKPFYKNLRKELTKMPKAFFLDLGIRNYLIGDFNSPELRNDKGELWENFYFKLISDKYPKEDIKFWRTQDEQEIDFVIERQKIAIEIKSNPLRRTKIPKLFQEAYPEFTTDVLYGMIDIARFF